MSKFRSIFLLILIIFMVGCTSSDANEALDTPKATQSVATAVLDRATSTPTEPSVEVTRLEATETVSLEAATVTPSPMVTPDIVGTVVAIQEPKIQNTYLSPDGEWQAEVIIYECIRIDGENENAYEELKLIKIIDGTEIIVDSQLQYCGGLGAYGLEGLFWSENSLYFYYTNAREGFPDGCGYWQRPIIRFDTTDETLEFLGGGPVSPDETKLATWQDQELVVWDIDNGEIGRVSMAVPNVPVGAIVWSPDSQSLIYFQVTSYCPLSGKSYIVSLDLPDLNTNLVLESEMPTFSGATWDTADEIILFDEDGKEWKYNFLTEELRLTT
jgi:hypothetical protein